jgi:hypothetical protein
MVNGRIAGGGIMKTLRLCAVSGLVLLAFAAASGPVGSNNVSGCSTSFVMRDPVLRAQFAALDRTRAAEFKHLCGTYGQPAISQRG